MTVSFTTGHATPTAARALARAVSFANVSEAPSTLNRRVQLTLVDGDGGSDSAQVEQTVQVTAVNDPPAAVGEIYDLLTTGNLSLNALQGVLINDTDLEGDPLAARLVQTTQHGLLTLREDGSLTYQPDPLYFGLDAFTYQAFDGHDLSNVVAVGIQVRLPATNPSQPADVNGDGYVSPLDPLWAANWLEVHNPQPVPAGFSPPPFVDVTGDGTISDDDVAAAAAAIDAGGSRPVPPPHLEFPQEIPELGTSKFVQIRLQASDANGQPLASVPAAVNFYLDVLVKDLRSSPLGVFAAYLDVAYDSSLVSVVGNVIAGAQFPHYLTGDVGTAGLADEVGAGRTAWLPGSDEQRLVRSPCEPASAARPSSPAIRRTACRPDTCCCSASTDPFPRKTWSTCR